MARGDLPAINWKTMYRICGPNGGFTITAQICAGFIALCLFNTPSPAIWGAGVISSQQVPAPEPDKTTSRRTGPRKPGTPVPRQPAWPTQTIRQVSYQDDPLLPAPVIPNVVPLQINGERPNGEPPTQTNPTPNLSGEQDPGPTPLPSPESEELFEVNPGDPSVVSSLEIKGESNQVTIIARSAPLADVLNLLSERYGLNFVHGAMTETITISLHGVRLEDALSSVLGISGYTWTNQRGIVLITRVNKPQSGTMVAPEISGRQVRVFPLDYVSAEEISAVIKGMLSPMGKSYVLKSDTKDNRKTNDQVVVEDLPGSLARIEQYIRQVDIPPRQVLIEARVLEVKLRDSEKHGINFESLARFSGHRLTIGTVGANLASGEGAFFAQLDSNDVKGLINALQNSVDTKTLASPRIMVVNGQQARLQVGQQLGFRVLLTNQTSTLEQVQFLDVGVVLSITPRISRDGQILLSVKPEVSSGQINPNTGLPEEETSEVETNVLLSHGKGMVIGGLIQEKTNFTRSQVPKLGNLPVVGKLFRNHEDEVARVEIIFVLVPRVISPYQPETAVDLNVARMNCRDQLDVMRTENRVVDARLCHTPRPYDRQAREFDRTIAYEPPLRNFPLECLGTADCQCSQCQARNAASGAIQQTAGRLSETSEAFPPIIIPARPTTQRRQPLPASANANHAPTFRFSDQSQVPPPSPAERPASRR